MAKIDGAKAQPERKSSKFFKGAIVLFTVLDVEAVTVEPAAATDAGKGAAAREQAKKTDRSIQTLVFESEPDILSVDVAIAGGGMGGVAAALSLGSDLQAVLTEETSWLGGQLSSQGVAALDENKYVESTGACANYLQMREAIRQSYRDRGNLSKAAQADPILNPGSCWVTRLAFEPEVALAALDQMLAPQSR